MSERAAASLDDVVRLLADIRDLLQLQTRQPAELLSREDVALLMSVGLSTFDRMRAAGRVGPRPLEFGGVKYNRTEVEAWLRHRDQAGELFDAKSWPPVWASLQTKPRTR